MNRTRIGNLKEIDQADAEWCFIELGCALHRVVILRLLDSFTYFSLILAEMEDITHCKISFRSLGHEQYIT